MAHSSWKPCAGPMCGVLVSRTQYMCDECRHRAEARDREVRGTATERGYGSKWRGYRSRYLKEHPLCVECEVGGRTTAATVVDHVKAHKGDKALFWAKENHRALCKPCHDKRIDEGDFGKR
jgi:5-methylcytosine-specific restriction enzyme A